MPVRINRSRRARWALLAQFGAGSLVPLLLLGGLLASRERDVIRSQQEQSTAEFAKIAARGLLSFILRPSDLAHPLPPDRAALLDLVVNRLSDPGGIPSVRIVTADGTVRYSNDRALLNTRLVTDTVFRRAVAGQTLARHMKMRDDPTRPLRDVLRVDIPTRTISPSAAPGVVEILMGYDPIAADTAHRFGRSAWLIGLGLGGLWLTLLPLVLSVARRLERQVDRSEFLALHDGLTGLPNRVLLRDRVERVAAAAHRRGDYATVMLLDLDRFKEVNDTLGHDRGDGLLRQISERLSHGLRDADTVARLGGDEFVILVADLPSEHGALDVADRVAGLFEEPFFIDGVRLDVEASIGLAVLPTHGETFEDLLQRADIAMYAAKTTHVGPTIYTSTLDVHSPARLALLGDMRTAIDGDEFVLHFQPKLDLRSGAVQGFEALVRWQHPERGLVRPDDFIPLAERTGLIRPLTTWVLTHAIAQARTWLDDGLPLPVAVNVSARSLLDPTFPDTVARILDEQGVPASLLEIEITETAIMADPVRALEIVTALAERGVQLSIDDFGVGYSSMSHLKRLPVHELKIDRSFVAQMRDNENDAIIVRSTVDLGRNLGLRVVAEGVETEDVSELLREIGCDQAQGYYFCRPMPQEAVGAWLREHRAAETAEPIR